MNRSCLVSQFGMKLSSQYGPTGYLHVEKKTICNVYIYIYPQNIPKISPRYPQYNIIYCNYIYMIYVYIILYIYIFYSQYNISPRYVLLIFSHSWMPPSDLSDLLQRPRVRHRRHAVDLTVPDLDLYTHLSGVSER